MMRLFISLTLCKCLKIINFFTTFKFYSIIINLKEQLIDAINSARNLIKTRLVDPQQLPGDKKMVELMDDLIQRKISKKN